MSDSTIDVEPSTYTAASQVFGSQVAEQLATATSSLQNALASTGAMAGSDPGGQSWARSYDQAAGATATAVTDLVSAAYKLGAMLELTGFNHGRAEDASNPRSVPITDITPYRAPILQCWVPPSASGGSGGPPHGWGLIQAAVGYVWPNGHPNTLRNAAHAWTSAANTLSTAAGDVPAAVRAVRYQKSAEVPDAVTVCQSTQQHIDDVANTCRSLAAACTELADHIDHAHQEIGNELKSLLEWTIGIEAGGAILGFFTAGISEGAAQVAEAARIAATAARVSTILTRLVEAATTAAEAVGNVIAKIVEITQRLQAIIRVTPKVAEVEGAATKAAEAEKTLQGLAADEKAAETAAAAKLPEESVDTRLSSLSPDVREQVRQAIERARAGETRFPGRDGKLFNNFDKQTGTNPLPQKSPGYYQEWTAASQSAGKSVPDRVIIGGNPASPDIIYYWDHGSGYTVIYP